ncbi:MAG: cyclic nucleotide-binding domain-containing protein [Rhodopseudomonas sp.]|nr:cyclic nucleotide-binding domain-containing protein [Rhodopseudomonas sp.]
MDGAEKPRRDIRMDNQPRSGLRADLTGGLVSAALSIPLAVGYGMFAFGSLGSGYFAAGALSGLYAAVTVGIACVLFGDRSTTVYAPRVTTTFFLGALLYQLVHTNTAVLRDSDHHLTVLAFFAIIFLGGAFQALFGLVRLGSLIRFTPHPVMAGLQNAAAALLFLVQLGNVCGFDRILPFTAVPAHWLEIKPLSLVVAGVTFFVMFKAKLITKRIPPLLVGLGIGSALYYALIAAGFGTHLGSTIGLPDPAETLSPLRNYRGGGDLAAIVSLLPVIVSGALALAAVAALDALLCAKLVAPPDAARVDGNKLLMRLGLGNMLSASVGGITSGLNIGPSIANRAFGARSYVSVLINAAVLMLVIGVLFPVVSYTPRSVLSATIMVIAVQHIDPWSIDLIRRIRASRSRHRGFMLLDLLVIAAVAILSVTINIVFAVFLGIAIAVALFIVRVSHSNIRRAYRCDTIHSRKTRTPAEAALLEKRGTEILVLELQGALFFGSAETLSEDIERRFDTAMRTLILDLRRVTEIDATGARILNDIRQALARRHQHLALSMRKGSEVAANLTDSGLLAALGPECQFEDVDRAIEWAEDELLAGAVTAAATDEISFEAIDLFSGLTSDDIQAALRHTRRETFARGSTLFREGDPGNKLFIITKGRASAYLSQADGGAIRLVTFATGTIFGELAILDAGPRSASVVADDDIVVYSLSDTDFAALGAQEPAVAIKLLAAIGRELSGRLRRANRTIHHLES